MKQPFPKAGEPVSQVMRPRQGAARRRRARGFTLIEILVATGAGLFVSMAALMLSKTATRFFQHEARISSAQLAVTLGMNRLTADLQRAAFLSTRNNWPNGGLDSSVCVDGGVVLPIGISRLAGIGITVGGSALAHPSDLVQSLANSLNPDSVILSGSFDTTEIFTVRDIRLAAGSYIVRFEVSNNEAMARLTATATVNGQTLAAALGNIFVAGRFLRIVDESNNGKTMYGIIASLSAVTGVFPNQTVDVTLAASPTLPSQGAAGSCGIRGLGRMVTASVVSRVLYDLRSLAGNAQYGALVAGDPTTDAVTGAPGHTELVRVELDSVGAEKPTTLELVAEYAVDLKFGVTKAPAGAAGTTTLNVNPTMTTYPFDDPEVGKANSEYIRAVQAKLSTRTRVPDREVALSSGGRLYTFAVFPTAPAVRFARLRTLYATVSLPSQKDFSP